MGDLPLDWRERRIFVSVHSVFQIEMMIQAITSLLGRDRVDNLLRDHS